MTNQQEKHKLKRKNLKKLSEEAKIIIGNKNLDTTINKTVIEYFYKDKENLEFYTLHQWSKKGYKIKKGSVSFAVWGTPLQKKEDTEKTTTDTEQDNNEIEKYYPLCYLFSNAQVEKINET